MTRQQWIILLISAATDLIINAGTALTAAMVAKGDAMLPSWPVMLLALIGGLVSAARTIQQWFKANESITSSVTVTRVAVEPVARIEPPHENP